jgi:hypothetical protein
MLMKEGIKNQNGLKRWPSIPNCIRWAISLAGNQKWVQNPHEAAELWYFPHVYLKSII